MTILINYISFAKIVSTIDGGFHMTKSFTWMYMLDGNTLQKSNRNQIRGTVMYYFQEVLFLGVLSNVVLLKVQEII